MTPWPDGPGRPLPPAPDDTGLGVLFAEGDERALAWAYERWSAMVHGYACSRLGSGRIAEDVTADVFISAWRLRGQYGPDRASLAMWILGITHRQVRVSQQPGVTRPGAPARRAASGDSARPSPRPRR